MQNRFRISLDREITIYIGNRTICSAFHYNIRPNDRFAVIIDDPAG